MIVKGKTLYLRAVREKDLDTLYDLTCDIEARGPYYPIFLSSESEFKRDFQEDGFMTDEEGEFLICDFEDRLLGLILYFKTAAYFDGFEVAYRLFDTGQSNRGLMTEALTLCTYLLFAIHKINRLELKIFPENAPSKRVAEKAGYKLEGVARGAYFHRGAHRDLEVHSILRQEAPATLAEALAWLER
jgi:RimJ/RimL family protein N-acetyltransferase